MTLAASRNNAASPVTARIARSKSVRSWWETGGDQPDGMVGLALSGGGIRSATFSLGVIQALARSERGALANVDIVSTVSGGGYIGCFLRSLFMPDRARGIAPKVDKDALENGSVDLDEPSLAAQHAFAMRVLASGPHRRDLEGPAGEVQRNPLWWLREHSRYLAPNGPTDFAFALAYLARNWIAMLYIFLLASLGIFTFIVLLEAAATLWAPATEAAKRVLPVSPAIWIAAIPLVLMALHAIAYWITQAMSPNEPDAKRQRRNLVRPAAGTLLAATVIFVLTKYWLEAPPPYFPTANLRHATAFFFNTLLWGLVLMAFGVLTALVYAVFVGSGAGLTSELRRRLTKGLTVSLLLFNAILAIVVVDTIGMKLAAGLDDLTIGTSFAAILPAIAYLIKKLPDWFGGPGGDKSKIATLFGRFLNTIALILGLLLFGGVAVGADTLAHAVAWGGSAWEQPQWERLLLFASIVAVLGFLSGYSDGFINLSSLHALYSARLTRAYLGASNNGRLAAAYAGRSRVTESHPGDYIQPQIYCRADLPAPLHLINATINETIDPQSQLVSRDRKGDILTLEPQGIRVANEPVDWTKVGKTECAEQLSLGQWCSISGAAASSGMGRLTSLGLAMAFTFANVRLGYWWWSPGACMSKHAAGPIMRFLSKPFGTFVYLFNEMTARYSRGYDRKYITDGGHFENSGAYRLLERRVPLILVCDNGADPKYRFEDLENLVRKVRLDLGGETELLQGAELTRFLDGLGAEDSPAFVDPGEWDDWRDAFIAPAKASLALVLRATFDDGPVHLIWMKPRVQPGMPADLLGYTVANPAFPQQPTGDQFFDEAQWESYRRLGELCMARLLEACPEMLAERALQGRQQPA